MTGLLGKRGMIGFSMLRPFCESTMAVLPGVTAGSMMSATVGDTSGMFLVVTRMKSNGFTPSLATLGTLLTTEGVVSICYKVLWFIRPLMGAY